MKYNSFLLRVCILWLYIKKNEEMIHCGGNERAYFTACSVGRKLKQAGRDTRGLKQILTHSSFLDCSFIKGHLLIQRHN